MCLDISFTFIYNIIIISFFHYDFLKKKFPKKTNINRFDFTLNSIYVYTQRHKISTTS